MSVNGGGSTLLYLRYKAASYKCMLVYVSSKAVARPWQSGAKGWEIPQTPCPQLKYFFSLVIRNLALQLVVLHVKLENMEHGVLRDALVEVSGTQIVFH